MSLSPGIRLGYCDVTSLLGEGGMGQVWQATDTQLGRQVALKILPGCDRRVLVLSATPVGGCQSTISSLNHPHICILYDIGDQDGMDFLVMAYLE